MSLNKFNRRIAIFVSGSGSTLQALLDMQEYLCIGLVVTNKKKCLAVTKARRFGIPVLYFERTMTYSQLNLILKTYKINSLFLAGFMKIVPADFLSEWVGHIFNIHPSLLPKYKGLNAFERALEQKDSTGASIHHVVEGVDEGEVILQKKSLLFFPLFFVKIKKN